MHGDRDYYSYMNRVLGAKDELQVKILMEYKPPTLAMIREIDFLFIAGEVDRLRTRVQIRSSIRNKAYSVRFDAATKQKVRHLLNQIKEIVDEVELHDRKKEALYSKINALANEVDRDRTHVQAFGALVVEMAGIVGEAADKRNRQGNGWTQLQNALAPRRVTRTRILSWHRIGNQRK
jgi:hypothetical protein